MATRSGGISGAIYALVIFVFLFVIATSLAILFYTQRTKAQDQAAQTDERISELVRDAERSSDVYNELMGAAEAQNRSLFAEMSQRIEGLARLLTGDGSMPLTQIEAQLTDDQNNVTYAIPEMRRLEAAAREAQAQVRAIAAERDKVEGQIAKLEADMAREEQAHRKELAELSDVLEQQKIEYDAALAAAKAERDELTKRYEDYKAKARATERAKDAQIAALNSELAQKEARIQALVNIVKENRLTAPDMTLEYDGQIIDVEPAENIVHINLGRDDRLILGMTFEVFDKTGGVQTQVKRHGQLIHVGGKASIEVIRFSESGETAACRVIRQSFGRPLVEGDIVSNIVFDRNREFRFFVYGDFDLNNDGKPTPTERQRVVQLIEEWGGVVIQSQTMPVDTDFLILGQNIEYPQDLPDEPPPTLEDLARLQQKRDQWRTYEELSGLARELSIPVLTQNRFLTLIGYYER
jgi:hypothetical protein